MEKSTVIVAIWVRDDATRTATLTDGMEEDRVKMHFGWVGWGTGEKVKKEGLLVMGASGSVYIELALHSQFLLDMQVRYHISKWLFDYGGQGRSQTFFNSLIILAAQ